MNKIEIFLNDNSCRNSWIYYNNISMYLRKSIRFFNQSNNIKLKINCLDLASIKIPLKFQHKGKFKKLLQYLKKINPYPMLYIENVLNENLYNYLKSRIDCYEVKNTNCFLFLKDE